MRLNPLVQPFSSLGFDTLQSELNRLFERAEGFGPSLPAFEVLPEEAGLRVRALVPGVAPENLDIEVEDRWLTLRGRTVLGNSTDAAAEADGENGANGQRGTEFARRLRLPFEVDADAAQAKLEHGVLDLYLPRPAKDAPRKIRIAAGPTEAQLNG